MAYFTQERKNEMAPKIKAILAKYGLKGSLSVNNRSTVVLTVRSGRIDFISNYNECVSASPRGYVDSQAQDCLSINPYWYKNHFSGTALNCLGELMAVLYDGNHDRSDIQSDYFDVGWYVDVKIGTWDTPYIAG